MKIGLVLSGGIAKGAYQAGFLKAVEEFLGREQIVAVAGSSIGMINGYAYCTDKVDKLIELWESVHFESLVDVLHSVWTKKFLRLKVKSLLSSDDFMKVPMYSPIVYLPFVHMSYCKLHGKYNPKWYRFFRGAMGFPILAGRFRFFRGQLVIDGGAMDNVPVLPLVMKEKPDIVLVAHFAPGYRTRKIVIDQGVPVIDFDIALGSKYGNRSFDFNGETLKQMVEDGYQYGRRLFEEVFIGKESIEEILSAERVWSQREEKLRMQGKIVETCIQKLNDFFYPFMRHDCKNLIDISLKEKNREVKRCGSKKVSKLWDSDSRL